MPMSRNARIGLIVVSIPVALILIAVLGAKIYFSGDRLKNFVIPKIEEATHRTVSVRDIGLSVFPTIAVSVESLSISNPPGGGFASPSFMSLAELDVRVKLLPLLKGTVEVGTVVLDHPVIYLEVSREGTKNSKFGTTSPGAEPAASSGGGMSGLLVNSFEIRGGTIHSADNKFDSRYTIAGLDLQASVIPRPGDNALVISGNTSIGGFSYGSLASWFVTDQPLKATLGLSYNPSTDALSFDHVNVTLREVPLTVTGMISQLKQETLIMNLTVTAPGVQMGQLLSLIPPEMLKSAKGLQSSGNVSFTATIHGPSSDLMNPEVKAEFTVSDGKIQYASLPKAITGINLHGTFEQPSAPVERKDLGKFALDRFTAAMGSNTISGRLATENFADPAISLSLGGGMNLAEVKDYYPLEPGTELSGNVKANVAIDGKAKVPQSLKASGTITFQNVAAATAASPKPVRNLNGTVTFNNQQIEAKQLAMNIGESDLACSFALKNYLGLVMKSNAAGAPRPSATVSLTSNQLRTADIMSAETAAPAPGQAKPAVKARSALLPDVDVDASVNIKKLVTDKFTFTNAAGTLGMSKGLVNLKNFSVNAFDGTIQSKGTLDLRDPAKKPFDLDLAINNVESHSMLPKFTSFGNYLQGKLSMKTAMKGDLDDTMGIDRKTLLGNGALQIAEGKLTGLPVTEKLAGLTNLSELKQIVFSNWANSFAIENGRLIIKDLKINSGQTNFTVGGSQGLDGSLDYTLGVRLPGSVSDRLQLPGIGAELMPYLKDKDGRINLSFAVSGTSNAPSVRFDSQAQQQLAKQAMDAKKQQLLDQGKKKLEEGLKNLFKKP